MKNLKYLIFLVFFSTGFLSCEEELNLFPENTKIPEFDKLSDFEEALVGTYNSFQGGGAYAKNLLTLDAWTADDMVITERNLGDGAFLHQWNYAANDQDLAATWSRMYVTIRRANNIIVNRGNISGPEVDQIVGEALGIRALCHLELYKVFGERYGDGSSLGVIYTDNLDIERKPARLTSEAVLQEIENDIDESEVLIDDGFQNTRITKVFLDGLRARAAMYREEWADVVTYTTNAIDNAPELATMLQYPDVWNGQEADHEVIFKVVFLPGDGAVGGIFWNVDQQVSFFAPSREIIDLLKENGGKDVRLSSFINEPQERVTKYIGPPGNANLADVKVMRTSELYLLRAEAYANLGDNASAKADLDAIRINRIPGYTPAPEPNLLDAIRTERRKELCYEGFRFFDLKRWNLPVERGSDCVEDRCTLPADDFRMVFPIPQGEIFANDNAIQNPGY